MDELQKLYEQLLADFAKYENLMTHEEALEMMEALSLIKAKAEEKKIVLAEPPKSTMPQYTWDTDNQNTNSNQITSPHPATYTTSQGVAPPPKAPTKKRKVATWNISISCIKDGNGNWVQQESNPVVEDHDYEKSDSVVYDDYILVSVHEEYYDEKSDSLKTKSGSYEVPLAEVTAKKMNEHEKHEARYKRDNPVAYWTIKVMKWNPLFNIADNIGNERDILTNRKRSWAERATNIAIGVTDVLTLGEGRVVVTFMYFGSKGVELAGEQGAIDNDLAKMVSTGMTLSSSVSGVEKLAEKNLSLAISPQAAKYLQDSLTLTGLAFEKALEAQKNAGNISEEDYNVIMNVVKLGVSQLPN